MNSNGSVLLNFVVLTTIITTTGVYFYKQLAEDAKVVQKKSKTRFVGTQINHVASYLSNEFRCREKFEGLTLDTFKHHIDEINDDFNRSIVKNGERLGRNSVYYVNDLYFEADEFYGLEKWIKVNLTFMLKRKNSKHSIKRNVSMRFFLNDRAIVERCFAIQNEKVYAKMRADLCKDIKGKFDIKNNKCVIHKVFVKDNARMKCDDKNAGFVRTGRNPYGGKKTTQICLNEKWEYF